MDLQREHEHFQLCQPQDALWLLYKHNEHYFALSNTQICLLQEQGSFRILIPEDPAKY